jgi:hypothetical protein
MQKIFDRYGVRKLAVVLVVDAKQGFKDRDLQNGNW